MKSMKPALTFYEQLEKFKLHNIKISDDNLAINILKQVNYYKLLGYGVGLKNPQNPEEFINCSIEMLFRLYTFDSRLRNLFHLYLEYIEIEFKTKLSNYMSLKYGPECYRDESIFVPIVKSDGTNPYSIIVQNLDKEVERHKNALFVRHHIDNYDGHFPFWVAVELMSFGDVVSIYRMLNDDDKKAIYQFYGMKNDFLTGWLLNFVEIRNICAHNNRLYNIKLKQQLRLYKSKFYDIKELNSHKLFPSIIVIKRIFNSDERWGSFNKELKLLILEFGDVIRLDFLGFPENWKEILSK